MNNPHRAKVQKLKLTTLTWRPKWQKLLAQSLKILMISNLNPKGKMLPSPQKMPIKHRKVVLKNRRRSKLLKVSNQQKMPLQLQYPTTTMDLFMDSQVMNAIWQASQDVTSMPAPFLEFMTSNYMMTVRRMTYLPKTA